MPNDPGFSSKPPSQGSITSSRPATGGRPKPVTGPDDLKHGGESGKQPRTAKEKMAEAMEEEKAEEK